MENGCMEGFSALQAEIRKHRKDGTEDMAGKESFYFPPGAGTALAQMQVKGSQLMIKRLAGNIPYWIFRRMEEMEELFGWFLKNDKRYILFLQPGQPGTFNLYGSQPGDPEVSGCDFMEPGISGDS